MSLQCIWRSPRSSSQPSSVSPFHPRVTPSWVYNGCGASGHHILILKVQFEVIKLVRQNGSEMGMGISLSTGLLCVRVIALLSVSREITAKGLVMIAIPTLNKIRGEMRGDEPLSSDIGWISIATEVKCFS